MQLHPLEEGCRGQYIVGQLGGWGHEQIPYHEQIEGTQGFAHLQGVGIGQGRIGRGKNHGPDRVGLSAQDGVYPGHGVAFLAEAVQDGKAICPDRTEVLEGKLVVQREVVGLETFDQPVPPLPIQSTEDRI